MTPKILNSKWVLQWHPTGSAFTCDPPTAAEDIDYHVLTSRIDDLEADLIEDGWVVGGSGTMGTATVYSYRKGSFNIIAVESPIFFERLRLATDLAKRFNLLDKADRISLFEAVADDFYEAICAVEFS